MIVEHWDVQGMVTVALSLLLPLRMEQDADIDTYDYNCTFIATKRLTYI